MNSKEGAADEKFLIVLLYLKTRLTVTKLTSPTNEILVPAYPIISTLNPKIPTCNARNQINKSPHYVHCNKVDRGRGDLQPYPEIIRVLSIFQFQD